MGNFKKDPNYILHSEKEKILNLQKCMLVHFVLLLTDSKDVKTFSVQNIHLSDDVKAEKAERDCSSVLETDVRIVLIIKNGCAKTSLFRAIKAYHYVHPTGGGWVGGGHIIFVFPAFAACRPSSHLVSSHFNTKYLTYLYQIWYGC